MSKKKNLLPVKLGEKIIVEIESLTSGGEGIGRYKGLAVFVADTAPGDKAEVKITELRKNYARAKVMYLQERSRSRIEPECPVFYKCGGCQWQHLPYEVQLQEKTRMVRDNIERIGGINPDLVLDTIGSERPFYYRNKVQFPVREKDGRMIMGFYAPGTHDVVEVDSCVIQNKAGDVLAFQAKDILAEEGISVYDESTGRGFLRHIMVRQAKKTGELMLVLIANGGKLPKEEKIIARLVKAASPKLVSICLNVNREKGNVIMGRLTKLLWGKGTITDYIGSLAFHISAQSFYQVNSLQTEVLYNKVLEYAALTGEETVIDAYCGIGTISLLLAQQAKKVYGIEVVSRAIEDAKHNAELNGISNVEFRVGKSEVIMPELSEKGVRPEVIVIDPPRKGCERIVLETMADMKPDRIVYVSCNPSSLARDLACLAELGYEAELIQPVDMFSQTAHVECVVLLTKAHK